MTLLHRTALTASLVAILTAGCASTALAEADWVDELGYEPEEVHEIDVDRAGLPSVEISIEGRPWWLVFDTLHLEGLSLAPRVARETGLEEVGTIQTVDPRGIRRVAAPVWRVDSLEVLGQTWHDERASNLVETKVDGRLGPRFMLGRRFTLDYAARRIAVSSMPLPIEATDPDVLPLVPAPEHEGLLLVRGMVNGREVLIAICTGRSRSIVDTRLSLEANLPRAHGGRRIQQLALGTRTFTIHSADVIGLRELDDRLPEPVLLCLGSDVLSELVTTVDLQRGLVLLQRRAR